MRAGDIAEAGECYFAPRAIDPRHANGRAPRAAQGLMNRSPAEPWRELRILVQLPNRLDRSQPGFQAVAQPVGHHNGRVLIAPPQPRSRRRPPLRVWKHSRRPHEAALAGRSSRSAGPPPAGQHRGAFAGNGVEFGLVSTAAGSRPDPARAGRRCCSRLAGTLPDWPFPGLDRAPAIPERVRLRHRPWWSEVESVRRPRA